MVDGSVGTGHSSRARLLRVGKRHRWFVTVALAIVLFAGLVAALGLNNEPWVDTPDRKSDSATWRISTALADTNLVLLAITLLQGPLRVFKGGEPAVHLPWRRAFGVATAVTATAHVGFGLSIHADLWRPWSAFVTGRPTPGDPFPVLGGARGLANYLGAAALAVLIMLAVTSNKAMMRRLRERWKAVQRLSYLVVVIVAGHAVLYQRVEQRVILHRALVLAVVALAVAAQLGAWLVVTSRRHGQEPVAGRRRGVELPTAR